jgi:dipeptidyl aminopeptidase/acylaminoacyl peptidase
VRNSAPSGQEWSADAFFQAGFNVLVPTFRGMAANTHPHELFSGKVDDLLAAIELARAAPNVDPDRIYLAGLRSGGSLALLATVSGADVRGTFVHDA